MLVAFIGRLLKIKLNLADCPLTFIVLYKLVKKCGTKLDFIKCFDQMICEC